MNFVAVGFLLAFILLYLGVSKREMEFAKKLGSKLLVLKIVVIMLILENILFFLILPRSYLFSVLAIELFAFFINVMVARIIFIFVNKEKHHNPKK